MGLEGRPSSQAAGGLLILQSVLFMISLAIPGVWRLFTLYLPSCQRPHFGLHSVLDAKIRLFFFLLLVNGNTCLPTGKALEHRKNIHGASPYGNSLLPMEGQ